MNFRAKTVKESIVETVHIIRPSDLNDAGRLFGGVLNGLTKLLLLWQSVIPR